ncbi:putative small lipoprotein YifL [Thermocatellispora tengchongensis]|uniref:Putative small lipoprotein YifL n=1 Tax=Thermocatellispora tengchongensis TaxID=1073253 RepID=A0A840NZ62_9ACTN|nr:hypothetical protein [Thermocatellispora tengchongensis]MBB5130993.1 putative small lipoprotein YifL [Thermocatellispora tengchongensis]
MFVVLRRVAVALAVVSLAGCTGSRGPIEATILPATPTPTPTPAVAATPTSTGARTCTTNVLGQLLRLLQDDHPFSEAPPQQLSPAEHEIVVEAWRRLPALVSAGDAADEISAFVNERCAAAFNESSLPEPTFNLPEPSYSFSIPVPTLDIPTA